MPVLKEDVLVEGVYVLAGLSQLELEDVLEPLFEDELNTCLTKEPKLPPLLLLLL